MQLAAGARRNLRHLLEGGEQALRDGSGALRHHRVAHLGDEGRDVLDAQHLPRQCRGEALQRMPKGIASCGALGVEVTIEDMLCVKEQATAQCCWRCVVTAGPPIPAANSAATLPRMPIWIARR